MDCFYYDLGMRIEIKIIDVEFLSSSTNYMDACR